MEPEPPFLPARRFETEDGSLVVSEIGHRDMAIIGIGDAMSLTVRKAVNIESVSAHIYPDDPTVCYLLHALLLLIRGPKRAAGNCSR
jgi:hypothetical protein